MVASPLNQETSQQKQIEIKCSISSGVPYDQARCVPLDPLRLSLVVSNNSEKCILSSEWALTIKSAGFNVV